MFAKQRQTENVAALSSDSWCSLKKASDLEGDIEATGLEGDHP
jgi:hypothetical protein